MALAGNEAAPTTSKLRHPSSSSSYSGRRPTEQPLELPFSRVLLAFQAAVLSPYEDFREGALPAASVAASGPASLAAPARREHHDAE